MTQPLPPLSQLRKQQKLLRAEVLRRDFRRFLQEAWPVVEPSTSFIPARHADSVADHLAAVARGQIRKLIINIPPGHAKSLIAAVLWPAWVWTWKPEWRGLFCSYAWNLATRDSIKCRAVIESQWYKELFRADEYERETWGLRPDQNVKDFFENTKTGFRLSLGVAGKGTGYRGNCVLVDDALNASDAPSKAARDSAIFWWDQQMSSRVNNPATDSFVVIGQRLHEEDLPGHCLAQGGYEHLCLPSEFDSKRIYVTSLGTPDWRTQDGELLFPALYPKEALDEAKRTLGSEGYSGQHDQQPTPSGGGLLKKAWWRFWRWDSDLPTTTERPLGCSDAPTRLLEKTIWRWDSLVLSVDATFKSILQAKGNDPDFVCIGVWGAKGADRFLLYRFKKQIGFNETLEQIRAACALFPKCFRKLVEDKANGSAIIETLQKEIQGIIAIDPEGGKEARANAVAPMIEAGNVYLPEGAPWLRDFVEECAGFPRAKHDDQVDMTSQALLDMMVKTGAARTKMLVSGIGNAGQPPRVVKYG